MKLEIITPDSTVYSGKIRSIRVPGTNGSFQVLRDHAPIISTLENGTVTVVDFQGKYLFFEITGGMIEVKMNRIVLLAESAQK
ncbi:MAG: ATP synthase F1 subunit epsilon [Bacteroidales bacterium]